MPNFATGRRPSIDYTGGLLLAGAVTATVFWAEEALGGGYGGIMVYVLPIVAIAAIVGFIAIERRVPEPIVPLHLFKDSTITLALIISVISGVSTLGMLNYFALFLQTVTGLPPALAGLLFLPSSVGSLVASIGTGYLVARTGRYKPYPIAAMALGVAVMLAFTLVHSQTPLWVIGVLMFFFFGLHRPADADLDGGHPIRRAAQGCGGGHRNADPGAHDRGLARPGRQWRHSDGRPHSRPRGNQRGNAGTDARADDGNDADRHRHPAGRSRP